MRRILSLTVLASGLMAATAAPISAQEEIKVVDHVTKQEKLVKGVIDSESPEGIKIKVGAETKLIPAADIKFVLYKLGTVKGYEYNGPFGKEAKVFDPATKPQDKPKLLAEARAEFEALAPKLTGNVYALRFIQFKIAEIAAQQGKADPTQLEQAVKLLLVYKTEQDKGWELVPCLKLLAQVQEAKGDTAEAKATYQELVKIASLPKEIKQESDVLIAQLALRTGKFDEAEKSLEALRTSLPPTDPQRAPVLLYLAQAQLAQSKMTDVEANIKAALNGTTEPALKATAHNTLGDFYRKKNQNEDAFWEYLRVDALYPQERNEHAKALYYLWKLFDEVKKDKAKSQECLDKLKMLDGTEYAKMVANER